MRLTVRGAARGQAEKLRRSIVVARIMVLSAVMACDAAMRTESVCSLVGRAALGHLVVPNGCAALRLVEEHCGLEACQ